MNDKGKKHLSNSNSRDVKRIGSDELMHHGERAFICFPAQGTEVRPSFPDLQERAPSLPILSSTKTLIPFLLR